MTANRCCVELKFSIICDNFTSLPFEEVLFNLEKKVLLFSQIRYTKRFAQTYVELSVLLLHARHGDSSPIPSSQWNILVFQIPV